MRDAEYALKSKEINDDSRETQSWAARALGAISDPQATDALPAALKSAGETENLRLRARVSLAKLRDPRAGIQCIIKILI
ncbi:MAG: HEAT repeat domain-containing protein [Candidatus Sumerlaeota bacterium]|nr:HEAT repeat domain-containing protein [Candidatus Sumerlaeota bacterium]